MQESAEIIIESKKIPSRRRKYIIAACIILCLLVGYIYKVVTWTPIDSEANKTSDAIFRRAAAEFLYEGPDKFINPEDLTDEDFAKVTNLMSFGVYRKEIYNIKPLEKFINLEAIRLDNAVFPESAIPKWMIALDKLGIIKIEKKCFIPLD